MLRIWSADSGELRRTVPVLIVPAIPVTSQWLSTLTEAVSPPAAPTGRSESVTLHLGKQVGDTIGFMEPVTEVAFQGDRIVSISGESLSTSDANPMATMAAELPGSKPAHLAGSDQAFAMYTLPDGPRILIVDDDKLRWVNPDTGDQIGNTLVSDAFRGVTQIDIARIRDGWR